MRLSTFGLLGGLAASAAAEDLLFLAGLQAREYEEAIALGYSVKTVTQSEWAALTTEDFSKFKAIIVPDPYCGSVSQIQFLDDSKDAWSPAVTGNIVLIGTDPSAHFSPRGPKPLIDNTINFAAAGKDFKGNSLTGLYFSLSCYYWAAVDDVKVTALDRIGDFTMRGVAGCYDKAHIVASSEALTTLDDAALSNWGCSVHEAFTSYPSVGKNGFQALAIAQDVLGVGSQEFGDGTVGLPYIIARGATPAGCGDGNWDEGLGEECDDGNAVNGDGCSLSCKCESGLPNGDGTCKPAPVCGDGTWDEALSEECDGGEGCSLDCKCESGLPNGDGTCKPAPVCGDGIWDEALGEECDGGEGCSLDCECESDLPNGDGTCAPAPVCGDGNWDEELGEECDGSEGCSSSCECESGLANDDGTCAPAPVAVCGDGIWDGILGEECDGAEGCSLDCKCESGLPKGDGTCEPEAVSSSVASSSVASSSVVSSSVISSGTAYSTRTAYSTGALSTPYGSSHNTSYIRPTGTGSYIVPSSAYPTANSTHASYKAGRPHSSYKAGHAHSSYKAGHAQSSYKAGHAHSSYKAGHPHSGYATKPTSKGYPHATGTKAYHHGMPTSAPNSTHHTYTAPPYATPACPTGPKIIGVEYIVEATYSDSSYAPCATSVRPIYDAPNSKLPCYICAIKSESVTYTTTDFVTVTTTTVKATDGPKTYFAPIVKPCESCAPHTLTETKAIGVPHTEYAAIPYVTPAPHKHQDSHGPVSTASAGVPATVYGASTGFVKYPAATGAPTKTGGYYPTKTADVSEFTGAAVSNKGQAAGLLGGVFMAVAALL